MKPFIHHSVASAALLMLGACSTYMPLDGGSTVPWAQGGSPPQVATPAPKPDRSRIAVQAVGRSDVPTVDLRGRVHRIEPGETLVSIARRYRVSVDDLVSTNRLHRPYVIYAGDVLRVPAGAEVEPVSARAEQHVVRRGESLSVIAERYGVSVSALARRNELRSPDALRVGQRLDVPAGGAVVRTAAAPAEEGFLWPVQGKVVTRFGPKEDGEISHGIAIAARKGAPVRAAQSGEVIYAGEAIRGYGRMVLIRHDDDYVTTYAHNQSLLVKVGDAVQRGQVIARVGDTGEVDRAQLHFELRKGRKPLDPEAHLIEPATEIASSE